MTPAQSPAQKANANHVPLPPPPQIIAATLHELRGATGPNKIKAKTNHAVKAQHMVPTYDEVKLKITKGAQALSFSWSC